MTTEEKSMRFAAPSIVREAISQAITEVIWNGADPAQVPYRAQLFVLEKYAIHGEQVRYLADDVRDWFLKHGPASSGETATHRRLMLALWQPEKFTG